MREAFVANFVERGEVGAAVCVVVNGVEVVNLAGGWTTSSHDHPWQRDTLVNFYSVGKPIVALLTLQLVDAGLVGLDDPIASLWPEFATGGKATATVRHGLCHQAGVPAIRQRLTNDDLWNWVRMTDALAATDAWWEPGSRHAYHSNTYGHLIGEVIRRATGEMPGTPLRAMGEAIDADIFFGVPESEVHRCADVIMVTTTIPEDVQIGDHADDASMALLGYFNPPGYSSIAVVKSTQWRCAQVPSTNGHGTAQGIARLYAALLEPGRLLSPALLDEATRPQSVGYCPVLGARCPVLGARCSVLGARCSVLGEDTMFGLGFKPTSPRRAFGPNSRSFGHFGTGGAVGFADPDAGVAFGYVMNHVIPRWQSSRNRALIDAVYRAL